MVQRLEGFVILKEGLDIDEVFVNFFVKDHGRKSEARGKQIAS